MGDDFEVALNDLCEAVRSVEYYRILHERFGALGETDFIFKNSAEKTIWELRAKLRTMCCKKETH